MAGIQWDSDGHHVEIETPHYHKMRSKNLSCFFCRSKRPDVGWITEAGQEIAICMSCIHTIFPKIVMDAIDATTGLEGRLTPEVDRFFERFAKSIWVYAAKHGDYRAWQKSNLIRQEVCRNCMQTIKENQLD